MAESDLPVYTVSRLNHEARGLLESGFPLLWIEGELSNLSRPSSGHMYFTLKDEQAQVRCAMFRGRNRLLRFKPADGTKVLIRAQVSLYVARGEFQLIVEHMEEAGEGALQRAFEELKRKLAAEGLFADELKRPLPTFPRQVGVITSATGAAVRDVLTTLRRRFPALPVVVYPVPVQGQAAAPAIAEALATANRRAECDVLILTRGGGSLEDLWSFNEPEVARAIRTSDLPVVVGVGHEVDVTIADFAADVRAPTPSAAAELVVPDAREWLATLDRLRRRLHGAARG
ncbi:MAG TPA: exodeoxyribonuclease VII large subunit, partial [Gammaproteobacteria bacterium]|nr:exodeoxyribonuclease VII large subunit [Gammaproteobacteria bacterium]